MKRQKKDFRTALASRGLSLLLAALLFALSACGSAKNGSDAAGAGGTETKTESTAQREEALEEQPDREETSEFGPEQEAESAVETDEREQDVEAASAPEIPGLVFESKMELLYAEGFDVYHYEGGYALLDIHDSARYLVVPEGQPVPEGLPDTVQVLQQPLDRIYLAATSAMALFDAMDAMDAIRLSGVDKSGWYIEHAVEAMESGDILFAGKYSEPDYELLLSEDCDLSIQSTMIFHAPKVQEMIEALGIPVLVDRSSYETHPLGRTEWIRLYSVLVDREEAAEQFFREQAQVIADLEGFQNTEKTVAFFYVSSEGTVVVREVSDYIPGMIEIAGGRYIFDEPLSPEESRTNVSISMEEFYAKAKDADYLIYNGSIDNQVESLDELLAKSELFADFKAVKEGQVWATGKYLYQATDLVGHLITDIHLMLTGGSEEDMMFLHRIA